MRAHGEQERASVNPLVIAVLDDDRRSHGTADVIDVFVERLQPEPQARCAERELLATGEHARKRTDDTRGQLTPQEAQISRLVGQGHTSV